MLRANVGVADYLEDFVARNLQEFVDLGSRAAIQRVNAGLGLIKAKLVSELVRDGSAAVVDVELANIDLQNLTQKQ